MAGSRKSTFWILGLVLLLALPISVLTVNPDWLSRLTYAVEVGRAQASQQQLAVASDLSAAFQHVARALRPSVVSVNSVRRVARNLPQQPFQQQVPEEFRRFFGEDFLEQYGSGNRRRNFEQRGLGSGVIVSDDGYILTNHHVVGGADEVTVTLSDGREFAAKTVGTDQATDLAVLKIEANNLQPAKLGDSEELEVGEWVLAMGSPFGLAQTVTAGIISATGRANVGITDYEDFVQTDAAINPGNSGGPLVNLQGQVIGINTAIASRSGGYMGIGFAIPSDMARYIMNSIIEEGRVTRGWLGAMIQDLNQDLARSFNYDSTEGVLVGDVVSGSPADKAGLKAGDIIVRFGDRAVSTANELRNLVAATTPGTQTELVVVRNGQRQTLSLTVGTLDPEQVEQIRRGGDGDNQSGAVNQLGITVQTLTDQLARELGVQAGEGVVVTDVQQGSVASESGIQAGDIITAVGNQRVTTAVEFREAIDASNLEQGIRLQVMRDGAKRFVFIRVSG